MSAGDSEILNELYRAIRNELTTKLRQSRLAPLMKDVGRNSRPGFTDLGVVTGFKEPDFIGRFGTSLDKVENADIAELTLYLTSQESLAMSLGRLAEYVRTAPEGKTGLPYFDEWKPTDDMPSTEAPVVWSHNSQEEPRQLLAQGYRIAKSKTSGKRNPWRVRIHFRNEGRPWLVEVLELSLIITSVRPWPIKAP